MLAGAYPEKRRPKIDRSWERLQANSNSAVDAKGRPVIEVQDGEKQVQLGVTADTILNGQAPPQLVRQLIEARLQFELRHRPSETISETEVARDWELLQKSMVHGSDAALAAHVTQRAEAGLGNKP